MAADTAPMTVSLACELDWCGRCRGVVVSLNVPQGTPCGHDCHARAVFERLDASEAGALSAPNPFKREGRASMATNTAQIGAVYVRSWGYDQTNVDYYELVSLSSSGKTGKARHLRNEVVSDQGQSTRVKPATGDDRFATNERCARCSNHHEGEPGWDGHAFTVEYTYQAKHDRVTVDGQYGEHAYPWDGQPDYQTGFGWGH